MSPDAKKFAKGCQFEESSYKVDLALVVAWFSPVNLLVCAYIFMVKFNNPVCKSASISDKNDYFSTRMTTVQA